jgi:hypothetical protein
MARRRRTIIPATKWATTGRTRTARRPVLDGPASLQRRAAVARVATVLLALLVLLAVVGCQPAPSETPVGWASNLPAPSGAVLDVGRSGPGQDSLGPFVAYRSMDPPALALERYAGPRPSRFRAGPAGWHLAGLPARGGRRLGVGLGGRPADIHHRPRGERPDRRRQWGAGAVDRAEPDSGATRTGNTGAHQPAAEHPAGARWHAAGAGEHPAGAGWHAAGAGEHPAGAGWHAAGAGEHPAGAGWGQRHWIGWIRPG